MPDPIIVLENLRKAYGSTIAANDLNLAIPRGECFGMLGPNGAGETNDTGGYLSSSFFFKKEIWRTHKHAYGRCLFRTKQRFRV